MQNTSQEKFRIEKVIKRKGNELHVKWKGCDNSFDSWIDKNKTLYKMSQYFPKPYRSLVETLMLKLICLIMQQNPI